MREPAPADIARLEAEASAAEATLAQEIAEAESDAAEIAGALREVRSRLEEHAAHGASGLDSVIRALTELAVPAVPMREHELRRLEARADALRARMWVVSAMREDLRRFGFELGECIKLNDAGNEILALLVEQPRSNTRPRLERIRAVTANLTPRAARESDGPRRQQPRIRLETTIDLHSLSNFYTGLTENISDGGLFLATDDSFEPGSEVELAFSLVGGVDVRARGVVRWHRTETEELSAGVGIAFTQLSEDAREAIQRFLARREPIYHD